VWEESAGSIAEIIPEAGLTAADYFFLKNHDG
jgi:hypothetical protein